LEAGHNLRETGDGRIRLSLTAPGENTAPTMQLLFWGRSFSSGMMRKWHPEVTITIKYRIHFSKHDI
jgi:hypothetical protein